MPSLTPLQAPPNIGGITTDGKIAAPIWVNFFQSVYYFLRRAPMIQEGILPPTETPNKIGDMYIDTVLEKVYVATGTNNAADWKILN